jgi:hypothetical protein
MATGNSKLEISPQGDNQGAQLCASKQRRRAAA